MSNRARAILEEALKLSDAEQMEIAGALLHGHSSQKDPGYDQAWEAELRRRIEAIDRGEVALLDEDELDRTVFGKGNG